MTRKEKSSELDVVMRNTAVNMVDDCVDFTMEMLPLLTRKQHQRSDSKRRNRVINAKIKRIQAEIALRAFLGAMQAMTVIMTPIPKYEKGTE